MVYSSVKTEHCFKLSEQFEIPVKIRWVWNKEKKIIVGKI